MVVLPARYGSSRFEGKMLARDTGKFLIQHTYEALTGLSGVDSVLIATDDTRIADACKSFGAKTMMTSASHPSGTDRVAEVAQAHPEAQIIVNVQGDEPEIDPQHVKNAILLLEENPDFDIATLACSLENPVSIADPNVVKVVIDKNLRAMYFSRSVIPYARDTADGISGDVPYRRHLGLYAYRRKSLLTLSSLPTSTLEQIEKLEQLRALEHGMVIGVAMVDHPAEGIDTPEQYRAFVKRYRERQK